MASWYLVKNHRHIGPYTREQLEQLKREGKLEASDFVITQDELTRGEIKYRGVTEIIRFAPPPPPGGTRSKIVPKGSVVTTPAPAPTDEAYEPPLGSFSDEDLMNNEVSRIFTQIVDSVELARSNTTNHGVPAQSARSGKTNLGRLGYKSSASLAGEQSGDKSQSFAGEDERSWLTKARSFAASPLGVLTLLLGVAALGAGYFAKHLPVSMGGSPQQAAVRTGLNRSPAVNAGGARRIEPRPAMRPTSTAVLPNVRMPTSQRVQSEAPPPPPPTSEAIPVSAPAEAPSREPEVSADEARGDGVVSKRRRNGPRRPGSEAASRPAEVDEAAEAAPDGDEVVDDAEETPFED